MAWLKGRNGALYRIAAITGVHPMEKREDRKDQTKVTSVTAAVTTEGGHTHDTELPFDDVLKIVNPDPPAQFTAPQT